jgi:sugar transferase EpsL
VVGYLTMNWLYRYYGKRLLDLALAVPVLILSIPVLGLVAFLVRLRLGSPVFFCQQRPGLHNKPFMVLKFRTMTEECDSQGNLLPDADRLTRLGNFLRSSSLDELPELLNVLKGEMSLVGPRPLLWRYLDRYTPDQIRRHEVKSGITGWAQVNGRNALSWEDRFKLDVWYVDHVSLWIDLHVIMLTFWKVLKREGISHAGHVTMGEFKGTKTDGPEM